MKEYKSSFGEKIRAARNAKGMTQQELADVLDLERSAIAHYERGTTAPQLKNVVKICETLEIDFEELMRSLQ